MAWNENPAIRTVEDIDHESPDDPEHGQELVSWTSSQCAACRDHTLWIGENIAFPPVQFTASPSAEPHPEMPSAVRELYTEAVAVLPHSRRAAAALSRAALEKLCKSLTADLSPSVNLNGRLNALSSHVAESTAMALHAIRHVGNKALHGANDEDGAVSIYLSDADQNETAELFFLAINELVDQRISRPRKFAEVYSRLPEDVRENITKAQAKTAD